MKFHSPKIFRGPGIAAVGYLTVVLSAALVVISLKVGQLTDLHLWIYWLPMLIGIAGVVAGFVIGAVGIFITWASFGNNEVNLDWITSRTSRVRWQRSTIFFKWGVVCIAVATIWSVIVYFWFDAGMPLSGMFFLGAAAFIYLGVVAKLWNFLASELSRLSA